MKENKLNYKKNKYLMAISLIILAILIYISLFTGEYDIKNNENGMDIFIISRIARTFSLILSAISMSICGLVMQIITRNKMVEPTTTSTTEWAGLGLILVYILIPSPTLLQRTIGAIIFSFIGTFIFFLFIRKVRLKSSVIVPIVGIMFGAIISSISTFISLTFNATQTLGIWFSASFSTIEQGRYELLWIIVLVVIIIYIFADKLTVVGLGEDIATNLGINYKKLVLLTTILVSITVGVVSSVIGNIPFLGLIVPNIVSRYNGDNLKSNLKYVCILGSIIMLICDIISRVIIRPFEVPVSLILGTIGALIFLILIFNQRGRNA